MDSVQKRCINHDIPNQFNDNGAIMKRSTGYIEEKEDVGKMEQKVKLKRQVKPNANYTSC